jgi:hypothetical protein
VRQGEMVVWSLEKKKKENRVVILFNDLLLETEPMVKKGRKGEPDMQVLKYLHSWNLYHVSPVPMPDTERTSPHFYYLVFIIYYLFYCF